MAVIQGYLLEVVIVSSVGGLGEELTIVGASRRVATLVASFGRVGDHNDLLLEFSRHVYAV